MYSQSDPSTSEDFDLIFSVEDEDIFPDVKKAAAFLTRCTLLGQTLGFRNAQTLFVIIIVA